MPAATSMGRRMRVVATLLGGLAVSLAGAGGALAAAGDGPYTPFPDPDDPARRALDYVHQLNRGAARAPAAVTLEQLERGIALKPRGRRERRRRAHAGRRQAATPFRQAGVVRAEEPPSPASWPYLLAGAGLACAAAGVVLTPRLRGRA